MTALNRLKHRQRLPQGCQSRRCYCFGRLEQQLRAWTQILRSAVHNMAADIEHTVVEQSAATQQREVCQTSTKKALQMCTCVCGVAALPKPKGFAAGCGVAGASEGVGEAAPPPPNPKGLLAGCWENAAAAPPNANPVAGPPLP